MNDFIHFNASVYIIVLYIIYAINILKFINVVNEYFRQFYSNWLTTSAIALL